MCSSDLESQSLVISVATPLYLYFIALLCQVKSLIEVDARFGFLHSNRLLLSTVSGAIIRKNRIDLKVFVRDPQMYMQLSLFQSFSI